MTMSYIDTKRLIQVVIFSSKGEARAELRTQLQILNKTEAEFYSGIVEHGPGLRLNDKEWFELLSRLPNRLLRSQINLELILTEQQRRDLPPPVG